MDRLQSFMRSLEGAGRPGWFLQLDVKNFFNTIDRRRLFGLIKKRVDKSGVPKFTLATAQGFSRCPGESDSRSAAKTCGACQSELWHSENLRYRDDLLPGAPQKHAALAKVNFGTPNLRYRDDLLWLTRRLLTGNPALTAIVLVPGRQAGNACAGRQARGS